MSQSNPAPNLASVQAQAPKERRTGQTVYTVLFAVSLVHLFNDSIQSVIPAIFPILKETMSLSFSQIGAIGFVLNAVASVMQPVIGAYTDRRPSPWLLPAGMAFTLFGMLMLGIAPSFWYVIFAVVLVGIGSAVFHPESSRVAYMAAGPRRGLAQSIFQVGGNAGQSLAPVLTYLVFIPLGQKGAIWFTCIAALAIVVQLRIAKWYGESLRMQPVSPPRKASVPAQGAVAKKRTRQVRIAMLLLLLFIFARSWYHIGFSGFYSFYLMENYGIDLKQAQKFIFLFLALGAAGTFFGGPIADRFGKKNVMLFSMLASAPLALLIPFVSLTWAYILCAVNGFIILSSFSVSVVYAQELIPGKIGTVSGLTIGLAFGMGAIGSAVLGNLADVFGIQTIMIFCGFLPLLGIIASFLPSDAKLRQWQAEGEQ